MKLERVLFIPDVHAEYHDYRAWSLMGKVMKSWRPVEVNILGDFVDCYPVMSYVKSPKRSNSLVPMFKAANGLLDEIEGWKPKVKRFFKGNHSARLETFIAKQAPELDGYISVERELRLQERGYTVIDYSSYLKVGKVYISHDAGGSVTGRTAAHKALDIYQHSIITGHTHRMIYVVEANGIGETMLSAQFGWLGKLKDIDYSHKIASTKAFVLGFGIGYRNPKSGVLYAVPVPIIDYTCCVEGVLYHG